MSTRDNAIKAMQLSGKSYKACRVEAECDLAESRKAFFSQSTKPIIKESK